jgi:hypothetical protein
LFVTWATVVAICLALWTVVAGVAWRHVEAPRRLVLAEALFAMVTSLTMAIVTISTIVWWASVDHRTSAFFGQGFAANPVFMATLAVMLAATLVAVAGSLRIARSWAGIGGS